METPGREPTTRIRAPLLVALVTLTLGVAPLPPRAALQAQQAPDPDATVSSEPPSGHLLTLDAALELARQRAPALGVADRGVDHAEARALEAFMARLPTLSARITLAPSGPIRGNAIDSPSGTNFEAVADIFDEFTYQLNSELRGTLPLYTFGKISLAEELADVGVEVAQLRRQKAELELVFDVTRAYLGLQLSQALDELISEGRRRLDDARDQLEERLFEGHPTARTQLRQLTIQEASFAGQVADNRTLGALAQQGLRYYCGLEGEIALPGLDDGADVKELDTLEALLELAWQHRPDLRLLEGAVRAADLNAQMEWRQLTPNFFIAFGLRFNRNPLADNQPSPFAHDPYNSRGFGVFVGLDWSLDFRQVARARQADREADRTLARQHEAVGGIEIEITQAYYEALGHQDQVEAYEEALSAARAWLRQRTIQFDSGLADFDQLSEPLLAYFATFAGYHQALFELRLARANLALKVGLEHLDVGRGLTDGGGSDD